MHRQAAVVRAAGRSTRRKAKIQVAEPDARFHRSRPPLLPMHGSLPRRRLPTHPNIPILPRTRPITDAN